MEVSPWNARKMALSPNDPTSFSNPEEVVISHIAIDLEVDFNKHVLCGLVNLSLTKVKDGMDHVILDTKDLTVQNVSDKSTRQQLKYTIGERVKPFGSKMDVQLPNTADKECVITIKYETAPDCSALQWLKPSQTAGKKLPYMFSQCQAIHCRSIIPCQDTPSVKCPYTAKITAPKDIKVLMSAKLTGSESCSGDTGKACYSFDQPVPMPSYLIAIVAGDLHSKDIGPRSKVWSEPQYVDQAAKEFAETEAMLKTAEDLLGPYVWGHYDLLVLPPSFPYGGMENPCLTFVTPTLLAGDQSLADVVAHEISHSWTGNLVTNKTFEDFWLNEGNTMFVERKIASKLKGGGGEPYRHFMAAGGWTILENEVKKLTNDYKQPEYTKLVPDMSGVDPDDAFSSVPYEKGHALIFHLEQLLGGPEVFDPFMKAYIEKFKYKSITTKDWKDFLFSYFHQQVDKLEQIDWNTWLYGEGMPPNKPQYDLSMAKVCEDLAARWLDCSDDGLGQFAYSDLQDLRPQQTMRFFVILLSKPALSHAKIQAMADTYKLNEVNNSEIKFRWLRLCIKARYKSAIPLALNFVTVQGRMKFVEPIYRDLFGWPEAHDEAVKNFEANKDQMHGTTVTVVQKALDSMKT